MQGIGGGAYIAGIMRAAGVFPRHVRCFLTGGSGRRVRAVSDWVSGVGPFTNIPSQTVIIRAVPWRVGGYVYSWV